MTTTVMRKADTITIEPFTRRTMRNAWMRVTPQQNKQDTEHDH